ncbi:DGQHR domain-containing protein [Pectobacterium brasiliense]|uniref:DGQHR domain-containing protein n=1 Tax=Pectobacterium brasiliense TaxID=180957 RepID=UPI0032EDD28C
MIELLAWNIGNEDVDCYVTVMKAKHIFNFSEVSRASEKPEDGYQRLLSKKRAEDISSYLNEGNIIPGAIILSAREGCNLQFNEINNTLCFDDTNEKKLLVIDGQHRLFGASLADNDILLPVCIFKGLDLKQEVQYFIDINSNQVGVPKTLRIELLKFLSEPESKEATLIKLFRDLSEDVESPLFGRTSSTASIPGKLSHVPFQASLSNLIEGRVLNSFNYEMKKRFILNFLLATSKVLMEIEGTDKRLITGVFFQALFKVFEEVCSLSLVFYKNYKEESLYKILIGFNKINFEIHKGTNTQNIKALSDDMLQLLQLHVRMLDAPDDLLG